MASANAMPSTASVITLPNAPGLRPTASEAFMPTSPTPIAEPRPQRPTWMLPLISARIGVIVICFLLLFPDAPAVDHGQAPEIIKSMMMFLRMFLVMRANQCREYRRQEHKHKCLHNADE